MYLILRRRQSDRHSRHVQKGIGEAAQPEPPRTHSVIGADDDHGGLAAIRIGCGIQQTLGDRLRAAQMAFGLHVGRHVGQAVLEPFPALLLDFGVERLVG